jgi:hypothetical protein
MLAISDFSETPMQLVIQLSDASFGAPTGFDLYLQATPNTVGASAGTMQSFRRDTEQDTGTDEQCDTHRIANRKVLPSRAWNDEPELSDGAA